MVKPKGLGRGLDALLGGDENGPAPAAAGEALRSVAVDGLRPGKYQPRTRMDADALKALSESIKTQGVMQPILARPAADGGLEIVAGERRWRAARLAGLAEVPVLVREISDRQALAAALIENMQREDLNPLEEAQGVRRLVQEFGLTHQSVADALGRSRAAITNLLRLLELAPPVQELLAAGKIDMGHARALLALPVARQIALAREAAARGWSVREIERRVGADVRRSGAAPAPRIDRDVARLQEEMSNRLGTTVQIKPGPKKGSGKLIIAYHSLEQFEALRARLAPEA
jgi:ParB family chromosome partitioning protein